MMSGQGKQKKKCKFFIFSILSPAKIKPDKKYNKRIEKDADKEDRDLDLHFLKKFIEDQPQGHSLEYKRYQSKTKVEMEKAFEEIGKDGTLSQYGCFFFVFLTFMSKNENGVEKIHYQDDTVPIEDIWKKVSEIKPLVGLPKVFLVQADDVALLDELKYPKGPSPFTRKLIPTDADRLTIVSTIPAKGYVKDGAPSFLIDAFIEEVKKNNTRQDSDRLDLYSLTTAINSRIVDMIEKSNGNKIADAKKYKMLQIPCTTSTLTKLLYI